MDEKHRIISLSFNTSNVIYATFIRPLKQPYVSILNNLVTTSIKPIIIKKWLKWVFKLYHLYGSPVIYRDDYQVVLTWRNV